MKPHILLVDDDPVFVEDLLYHLADDFELETLSSGEKVLGAITASTPDAVLLDIDLGAGPDGFEILRRIRAEAPRVPVIMVTRHETGDTARKAWRQGAFGYIEKGSRMDDLAAQIGRAIEEATLWRENKALREEVAERTGRLVGSSPSMKQLREQIDQVAETSSTVLVTGETGTGKELIAREIHERSPRARHMFVPVCCPALPKELVESELFGHEKGAFTGALTRRTGKFELAHKGTIFLDEISEVEPAVQAKLLRVLQERKVVRVGGSVEIDVDVRVIAATNRDLDALVATGAFREDLFYRLRVIQIHSPPLRDKKMDIPLLAQAIIDRQAANMNRGKCRMSEEALTRFLAWDWPGNVRELENVLESALVRSRQEELGEELFIGLVGPEMSQFTYAEAKDRILARFETDYLNVMLDRCGGNVSEVARRMGLTREGVRKMMKRRGVTRSGDDG